MILSIVYIHLWDISTLFINTYLSHICTHREKYVERQENKFITLFMHPNWLYSNVISREMKKTGNSGFIKRRKECYNLEIFRADFT